MTRIALIPAVPHCACGHSLKNHRGYDRATDLTWMVNNLGPCQMTECTCHEFRWGEPR